MSNIIKNIKNNLHHLVIYKFNKIQILFFLMFFFSLMYMLLDDSHFEGVNKFKEIVKEEVIKDKVQQQIKETFQLYENLDTYYKENKVIKQEKNDKIIDAVAKEAEKEAKKDELEVEKVEPSLFTKYLNRLYFAVITGCLLGYGDIYPVSNTSKLLTAIQGLLTVSLIIY
jgi:L-fucose mutarotase/ribose pyranase (RbsD/FucU family)